MMKLEQWYAIVRLYPTNTRNHFPSLFRFVGTTQKSISIKSAMPQYASKKERYLLQATRMQIPRMENIKCRPEVA